MTDMEGDMSTAPRTEAGRRLLDAIELDNDDVLRYGILAIEAEAATSSAAPEGLAKELRRAMYGLISERVTSGAPGDWMAFETAVNEAFDAILARLAEG